MFKKLICFVVVMVLTGAAQAAVVSYHDTAPGIGPDDVHFLGESINDETNVNLGDDGATYLAHDRPGMGQTFTTGTDPGGYLMTGFWLKNVMYDTLSGNGTWWYINNDGGGSQLQIRVVNPAFQGDVGGLFVVGSENYTVTGTETGNELMPVNWDANKLGTDTWVHFVLGTPVSLASDTPYGFDVTVLSGTGNYFIETAGVDYGSYIGGSAYSTGAANGTNSLNLDTVFADGDHTFVVELIPEPATIALLGFGGLALLRRKR